MSREPGMTGARKKNCLPKSVGAAPPESFELDWELARASQPF
jgi:hypothetical protein